MVSYIYRKVFRKNAVRGWRVLRMLPAVLTVPNGAVDILIVNVSTRGVGLKLGKVQARQGQHLELWSNELGVLRGTVRWRRGEFCGLLLDEPLAAEYILFSARSNAPVKPSVSILDRPANCPFPVGGLPHGL